MRPRIRKTASLLLAFLLLAAFLPARVTALGPADLTRPCTLTIEYELEEGVPAPGVEFELYRVAEVSGALTEDFLPSSVSLADQSAEGLRKAASTLMSYVWLNGLVPLDTGKTDREGKLIWENLLPGTYLVLGEQYKSGGYTYSVEPYLVFLPGPEEDEWLYDMTIVPKCEKIGGPSDGTVTYRVRKVWEDKGSESDRPSSVTVSLLCNGKVRDTVTLDAEHNWRHEWHNLDAGLQWMVAEQPVPGYAVSISKEGATFVVTNTITADDPDGPGKNNTLNKPNASDDPDNPDHSNGPSDPNAPDHSNDPSAPNDPDGPDEPRLPQTGALWWPVPVLLAAGLVLIVIGCARGREDDGG